MPYKATWVIFVVVLIIIVLVFWHPHVPQGTTKTVNNFEECAAAGYPVMTAYPEQCTTPDHRLFTKSLEEVRCKNNTQCLTTEACVAGNCVIFDPYKSCEQDNDCKLINKNLRYGCCSEGVCDTVNYSDSNWIAVNKQNFNESRNSICPSRESCGPEPKCPAHLQDDTYEARCTFNECVKSKIYR